MRAHGLDADWLLAERLPRARARARRRSPAACTPPHESAVDPRALIDALVAAFEAVGATVEIAEVTEALIEGDRLAGVRTAEGRERRAAAVVLAAGSWSAADWLPPEARPPVRPVKGQILTLAGPAAEPPCERIVVTERIYVVPRRDGRLIVGATVEEQGFDTRVTAGGVHELLREAYRALPEIAELELVETIAGLRPTTPDNLPLIGPGRSTGSSSPPGTSATGSCSRR